MCLYTGRSLIIVPFQVLIYHPLSYTIGRPHLPPVSCQPCDPSDPDPEDPVCSADFVISILQPSKKSDRASQTNHRKLSRLPSVIRGRHFWSMRQINQHSDRAEERRRPANRCEGRLSRLRHSLRFYGEVVALGFRAAGRPRRAI